MMPTKRKRKAKLPKSSKVSEITSEVAKGLCEYNPETGEFIIRIRNAGYVSANGYRYVSIAGRPVLAHRLAWLITYGYWPSATVDHINGNRSDNKLSNLREANWSENLCNSGLQKRNRSGAKGVYWVKEKNKWSARIVLYRKTHWLGYFESQDEAIKARKEAEQKIHGIFARVA